MMASADYAEPKCVLEHLGFTRSTLGRAMWGSWGSTGRKEMTRSSDVDWFCWDKEGRLTNAVMEIRRIWADTIPSTRLDLIYCTSPALVNDFATTKGTDLHCLYFLTTTECETELEREFATQQQMLRRRADIRARETVHLLITLHSFQKTFLTATDQTAKFALGGTRSWTTLAQFAAMRWPDVLADSTTAGLITLADAIGSPRSRLLEFWRRSFMLRTNQEVGQSTPNELSRELAQLEVAWQEELTKTINLFLPWIQEHAGMTEELLGAFLQRLNVEAETSPKPGVVSSEVERMVRAFITDDENVLVTLAEGERRWWPLHAILQNPNAPARVLHNLAFPNWRQDWWPWRNIVLYVARHPNTNADTLACIANTPGLRPMDYAAAERALAGKRNPHG